VENDAKTIQLIQTIEIVNHNQEQSAHSLEMLGQYSCMLCNCYKIPHRGQCQRWTPQRFLHCQSHNCQTFQTL